MNSALAPSFDADLYLARQFGFLFVSEPNPQQVLDDFQQVFQGDSQTQEQFDSGVAEANQKRLALCLTPSEFHRYHRQQQHAIQTASRRANGLIQPGKPAKAD